MAQCMQYRLILFFILLQQQYFIFFFIFLNKKWRGWEGRPAANHYRPEIKGINRHANVVSLARGLSHNDATSQTLFYYLALIIGVVLRFYRDSAIDHDIDNIQKMHA